jgi:hypothetical protein
MESQVLNTARKTFFLENNPEEAIQLIKSFLEDPSEFSVDKRRAFGELAGLACEDQRHYDEGANIFASIKDHYEAGYCQMLKGSLDIAVKEWTNLVHERPNHWCITLYGLITGSLNSLPTCLQLRNHLEADIMHLVYAGQTKMVDNLLKYLDILSDINYEVYKFAGRSFLHSGLYDAAAPLLLKGQKILPNDPEIYYHLGQYYYAIGKNEDSAIMLHQCLLITPSYTPASDLHHKIHGR